MENTTEALSKIQMSFSWYDYTLFSLMLGLSALIGVWFGVIKKQSTPDDYLMGGKTMKITPIALSLIASYTSGITLLGIPTDVYRFGSTIVVNSVTMFIAALAAYYIYVPVFFNLQITSTYEYIQLRFNAKLRVLASFLYTVSTMLYIPIVIYIPALAFSQATGINLHLVTPIVCAVCIFYTTIGGLKAVVWTDALQFGVMIGAIVGVFYMGITSAGGFGEVWTKASDGGRVTFDFDLDPTKRDAFYAVTIGTFFNTASGIAINQGYIQKYLALPTMKSFKWALIYFMIGYSSILVVTVFTGLIMYAKYADCDPYTVGEISRHDQILPYYVMDVSKTIPGLAGLFLSGLFSAALSTLSSCLNCLSGTIYEDFISPFMPKDTTKKTASNILKILVVIIGLICTVMVFVIERLGNVFPIQFSLSGITAGPLLGIFTLGMLFPNANSRGAMCGTVGALLIMAFIIIQSQVLQNDGIITYTPKSISVDGCDPNMNYTIVNKIESNYHLLDNEVQPFFLFRITYYYYTMMGSVLTVLIGVVASWLFKSDDDSVSEDVISPVVHWTIKHKKITDPYYYSVEKANSIVYTEKH